MFILTLNSALFVHKKLGSRLKLVMTAAYWPLDLTMSVISYDLNADSSWCADALFSHSQIRHIFLRRRPLRRWQAVALSGEKQHH